ncbi:hypothetical protein Tco_0023755 [Tanacetum coccineum]
MEVSVQQFSIDKKCLEIAKKEILLENDRLLQKIMSQDVLLTVINSMSLNNDSVNVEMQMGDSCEKCLNLDAELSKSKQAYKVFQNDKSYVSQNAVEIPKYFVINDLKARLQDKDITICKLKDTIKSLEKNTKEENVHHEKCDFEPINKDTKNRKQIVENASQIPSTTTIAPSMFKLDLVPLPPRLLQNREAHIDYIKHTQENANILWEIVELAKAKQPLDSELDFACKYATRLLLLVKKLMLLVQVNAVRHNLMLID